MGKALISIIFLLFGLVGSQSVSPMHRNPVNFLGGSARLKRSAQANSSQVNGENSKFHGMDDQPNGRRKFQSLGNISLMPNHPLMMESFEKEIQSARAGMASQDWRVRDKSLDLFKMLFNKGQAYEQAIKAAQAGMAGDSAVSRSTLYLISELLEKIKGKQKDQMINFICNETAINDLFGSESNYYELFRVLKKIYHIDKDSSKIVTRVVQKRIKPAQSQGNNNRCSSELVAYFIDYKLYIGNAPSSIKIDESVFNNLKGSSATIARYRIKQSGRSRSRTNRQLNKVLSIMKQIIVRCSDGLMNSEDRSKLYQALSCFYDDSYLRQYAQSSSLCLQLAAEGLAVKNREINKLAIDLIKQGVIGWKMRQKNVRVNQDLPTARLKRDRNDRDIQKLKG